MSEVNKCHFCNCQAEAIGVSPEGTEYPICGDCVDDIGNQHHHTHFKGWGWKPFEPNTHFLNAPMSFYDKSGDQIA